MEERDGYFTNVRHRVEAAVHVNGGIPGVFVAHSVSVIFTSVESILVIVTNAQQML